MAQLRDAQTSELIAEGTTTHVVTVADELGLKAGVVGIGETAEDLELELIYDGVGLAFDADAVRAQRDEHVDALAGLVKASKGPQRTAAQSAHKAAMAELEAAKAEAPDAQADLERARARLA